MIADHEYVEDIVISISTTERAPTRSFSTHSSTIFLHYVVLCKMRSYQNELVEYVSTLQQEVAWTSKAPSLHCGYIYLFVLKRVK